MKKNIHSFVRKFRAVHIVAAAMIVCMGLVDASLYFGYATGINRIDEDCRVINEEHEMDVAYADGVFDGNNSDSENYASETVELSTGKHLFCILEILPTEKKASIGYTIAGCEPFTKPDGSPILPIKSGDDILASEATIKEAYMDAVLNATPGIKDSNMINNCSDLVKDILQNMSSKLQEGGSTEAFSLNYNGGKYNGYYKWVGHNLGVFAEGEEVTVDGEKDKKMYSRFYNYSPSRNYDYIFVYSNALSTEEKDINVRNHRRIQYQNNDRFLKDMLGVTDLSTWKSENVIQVITRTPMSVTPEDIEKADLITVNNGNKMDYYTTALKIYNFIHGETNLTKDNGVVFSGAVDFTDNKDDNGNVTCSGFEKVVRIYERVAVREDAAFITSKNSVNDPYKLSSDNQKSIHTNMDKLMCMLFYVVTRDDFTPGSGRQFFMDFMKRYTSEPGNYPAGAVADAGKTYWDLRQESDKYIAPSLRNNSWNYMHHHIDGVEFHPGHPISNDINKVITSGTYVNGVLESSLDKNSVYRRTIRRGDNGDTYFENAGIHEKDSGHPDGYYKNQNKNSYGDELISDSQAYDHPWCLDGYESMSNTTDYIFIADDGTLVRDDKYSGDKGFWFKADYDDGSNWFAFKKIVWDRQTWTAWPWEGGDNAAFGLWLYRKGTTSTRNGGEQGNLHLWYDYYDDNFSPYKYRTIDSVSANSGAKNAKVIGENDSLKYDYIYNALDKRTVKREESDTNHIVERDRKDYYISMNILNGDGVNETNPAAKNKALYFNKYEYDDIIAYETTDSTNPLHNAKIPINIRIRSSIPIKRIDVKDGSGNLISRYTLNAEPAIDLATIEKTGTAGKKLKLIRPAGTYNAQGYPIKEDGSYYKTSLGELIYTYEGSIYDIGYQKYSVYDSLNSRYKGKRNSKFTVTLYAEPPGGNPDNDSDDKSVSDSITIVMRDFFMLD